VMARDVIDTALAELGEDPRACRTASIPLVGSDGVEEPADGLRGRLMRRYGSVAGEVLSLIDADPSLGQPLPGAPQFCRAEVVHACLNEGAVTLEDIVERRLRFGLHLDAVPADLLDEVAQLLHRTEERRPA
ncbi:MAG: glycerol-3-phosphate dehydrogenase C-terminal domain-containing protein, partial [Candidatus Nanopelagicales bacterium]